MRYWLLGAALAATAALAPTASAFHPHKRAAANNTTSNLVIGPPTQTLTLTTGVVSTGVVSGRSTRTAVFGANGLVLNSANSFGTNLAFGNFVAQPFVYQVDFRGGVGGGNGGKDDPPTNKADPELTKALTELTKALAENKTAVADLAATTKLANEITARAMQAAVEAKKREVKEPSTQALTVPLTQTTKDYKDTLDLIKRLTKDGKETNDEALKAYDKANTAYKEHTEAIREMRRLLKIEQ